MTLISADEAEALLDAATPGPWDPCQNISEVGQTLGWTVDQRSSGRDLWEPTNDVTMSYASYHNARLIAAAPDLAATVIELQARIDKAVELLAYIPSYETEPCRLDHHGYCQDHPGGFREGGCWVAATRAFLAALTQGGEQ